MKLPRLFHGTYDEVKGRASKLVAALKRGSPWEEAFGTADLVDTRDTPGLLVLQGPSRLVEGAPNFHCYVPWKLLHEAIRKGRLSAESEEAIFQKSIAHPWGIVGLLGQDADFWLLDDHRQRSLLDAAVACWDTLSAEGPRYSLGSNTGQELWALPTKLQFVLARLGVPTETLRAPLPPGGLLALAAQARRPL